MDTKQMKKEYITIPHKLEIVVGKNEEKSFFVHCYDYKKLKENYFLFDTKEKAMKRANLILKGYK
tara:strand:+ start:926 stop:1120 length:195 start_codon:yes stop_codon:yes gene_type:complete